MQTTPPPSKPRYASARWPWQRSLQSRIVLAYGGVFVIVLALLMARVVQVVYTAQLNDAEHNLEIESFLAANALEDPLSGYDVEFEEYARWESKQEDDDHKDKEKKKDKNKDDEDNKESVSRAASAPIAARLQAVANLYASDTGARVTILDPQGDAVADSAFAFAQVGNQLAQIEVQAALRGEEQHDIRPDPVTGNSTLYAAAPIQQNNRLLGVVQMSLPMADVTASIWSLTFSLVITAALALGVATALGVWISRRLVQPVRELEAASLAIAQGDLTRQVPAQAADELGALARAFNRMVGELQRMLEQQRLFVANASHELRTPITNIKLRSETLLDGGLHDSAIAERYLAEIDSEADRLGRLANALLDLSRLESADPSPPVESVDLVPVLLSVVRSMRMRVGEAGQTLRTELPNQLPPLRVWPEQIEAVVINLMDNAIKYTPEGGTIRLDAESDAAVCRIRVADSGLGIPAADLPHIFERFYRVDKARSRQTGKNGTGGAGLGLAIVAVLVERNSGRVWAESEIGQGTTITLEFPRDDA